MSLAAPASSTVSLSRSITLAAGRQSASILRGSPFAFANAHPVSGLPHSSRHWFNQLRHFVRIPSAENCRLQPASFFISLSFWFLLLDASATSSALEFPNSRPSCRNRRFGQDELAYSSDRILSPFLLRALVLVNAPNDLVSSLASFTSMLKAQDVQQ